MAFAGACADLSPPLEPLAFDQEVQLFGAAPQRGGSAEAFGLDAEFVRIAQAHPGFGGLFFGEDGALNLVSAGVQPLSARALGASLRGLGIDVMAQPVNVIEGQYDFVQLHAMHRAVTPVLGLRGVISTDADEVRNRVVIGVEDAAAAAAVERSLAMLELPEGAVIVERTNPVHPEQTLQNRVRPVAGGLQIWRFIPPGQAGTCTLGFNVSSVGGGVRGFVTNSHCTEQRGVVSGTVWSQKELALPVEPIGIEEHDLPFFTGAPCPPGQVCRYSDAAGARYLPDVDHAFGAIYRTLFPGAGLNPGSLEIDPANPRWQIVDELPYPVVGQVLHKTGRTSGWTMGPVNITCQTVQTAPNVTLFCQDRVLNWSAGGDSGAPYFERIGDTDQVRLLGIHWGSDGMGNTVMSAMANIRCENQGPAPWITFPGQDPPAPVPCPGR